MITGTLLPTRVTMMSNEIKIHLQFDLTLLYFDDVITTEEHDRLVEMFKSPDNENHVLAILAIESFKKRAHEKRK
jgi:hypothetical protein